MQRLAVFALSLASLAACGTQGDFADAAAEVEGIYRVTAYTQNDQACTPGGASLLGKDGFAFAVSRELFGITALELFSCENAADCRAKLAALDSGGNFALDFGFTLSGLEDDVFVGESIGTGFSSDGLCTGAELARTRLVLEGTALRLQQELTIADDYAPDAEGFCTTTLARAAASGNACSQLEALNADFIEPL